jgi:hypothetical protein
VKTGGSNGAASARSAAAALAMSLRADAETLLHRAHRVLLNYLPGVQLPDDLSQVRAMLDSYMFGLDKRTPRESVAEVARQIDRLLRPELLTATHRSVVA